MNYDLAPRLQIRPNFTVYLNKRLTLKKRRCQGRKSEMTRKYGYYVHFNNSQEKQNKKNNSESVENDCSTISKILIKPPFLD